MGLSGSLIASLCSSNPLPGRLAVSVGRWLSGLMLMATSLAVALVLAELLLRLAGVSYPNFHQVDAQRGNAYRPGASGWYREEGEAYISINAHGLRDRDHALEAAPDTFRIAVLGDSYAAAFQVPVAQAFWRVLERRLGECSAFRGQRVEVINFGVSGYGTAQELLTLRHQASAYAPDLVLLAFLTGNDIRNNLEALNKTGRIPYFVHQDGALVLDDSFLEHPGHRRSQSLMGRLYHWLLNRLYLLQLINRVRWRLGQGLTVDQSGQELGLGDEIYRPPVNPQWREAWQVTEDLLRLVARETHGLGARFVLVTLSNSIQVHPDPARSRDFAAKLGVDDLFYPDQRIHQLAAREGWLAISLARPFRDHARRQGVCLHGFDNALPCAGHWNAEGHRLAGDRIAQDLCRAYGQGLQRSSRFNAS